MRRRLSRRERAASRESARHARTARPRRARRRRYSFAAAIGAADGACEPPLGSTVTSSCAYLPTSSTMTTAPGLRERRQRHGRRRRRPAGPRPGTCGRRAGVAIELTSAARPCDDDDAAAGLAAAARQHRHDAGVGRGDRIATSACLAVARAVGRVVLRDRDQREDDGRRDAEDGEAGRRRQQAGQPPPPTRSGFARGAGADSARSARAAATMRSRRSAGGSLSATASASAAAVSSASS